MICALHLSAMTPKTLKGHMNTVHHVAVLSYHQNEHTIILAKMLPLILN